MNEMEIRTGETAVRAEEVYHQMSLDEWLESKNRIRKMIHMAKTSFVVIGYELRKIEETKAYEMDGYASLTEFAEAEYDFAPSMTSRLIAVNKAFSEGGYSDVLIDEAEGFSFSKLVEMKDLEPGDLTLIHPDATREEIRELKRFNKAARAEETAENPRETEFGMNPPEEAEAAAGAPENPAEAPPASPHAEWIGAFFKKYPEIAEELKETGFADGNRETLIDRVIPSGNRTFVWKTMFVSMFTDAIRIKKMGRGNFEMPWAEFFDTAEEVIRNMPQNTEEDTHELQLGHKDAGGNGTKGKTDRGNAPETPEGPGDRGEGTEGGAGDAGEDGGADDGGSAEAIREEPNGGGTDAGEAVRGEPGGEKEAPEGIAPAQKEEPERVTGIVEAAAGNLDEPDRTRRIDGLAAAADQFAETLSARIGSGDYAKARLILPQFDTVLEKLIAELGGES